MPLAHLCCSYLFGLHPLVRPRRLYVECRWRPASRGVYERVSAPAGIGFKRVLMMNRCHDHLAAGRARRLLQNTLTLPRASVGSHTRSLADAVRNPVGPIAGVPHVPILELLPFAFVVACLPNTAFAVSGRYHCRETAGERMSKSTATPGAN